VNNLVLQAYGGARMLRQARFCLLTFQHFACRRPDEYRAIVYSDSPEAFADLGRNVVTEQVSAETLRRWRGPIDFLHRIKLEMVADFFRKHEGTLLYVDSDTYFTADPAIVFGRITPGTAVMHENEGQLVEGRNTVARKLHRFVREHDIRLASGEAVHIPEETAMWNAGVIGLHPADGAVLASALPLTDALYATYPKHNMEQLAVSHALGQRLTVRAADDVIYHYWSTKPETDRVVEAFFQDQRAAPLPELAHAAFALRPRPSRASRPRWYHRLWRSHRR
jgi:hypothetical protein